MAAQIPRLQRRVAPEVVSAPRALSDGVDASGLAQGLSNLGADLAGIAAREARDANQTALLNADNALGSWQNEALFNPETGAFTKKGSGALGLSQKVLADFDAQQASIYDGLANSQQKEMFRQSALQRRGQLQAQVGKYEFGEQQQYKDDVDKSSIQLAMDSAALSYNDPQAVEQNRAKMDAVLQQRAARNGWSPEETQAQRQKLNSTLSQSVIERQVIESPQRAKALYEQYKGGMTADDQIRSSSIIDQGFRRLEAEARQRQIEARQLQAIARQELSSRVQDAQAAYLQGFEFANAPNKADFRAAYGNRADEAYESFAKVQAIAPAIREFATATPEERQQIVSRFQPAQDGVAREGFQQDNSLYNRLMSVGAGLLKQQQEDPAGYAARYSPAVQGAFVRAQQEGTPEAHEAYAAATIAEQKRLGVQVPRLLPEASAAQIANAFYTQGEGGENAATMIEQQQAQWGKNFPMIAKQLGKKLPQEAQIIATGLPKDVAERLASVAPLSESDLKQGLDKGVASEVSAAVQAELADFAKSLSGQAGGINTFNTTFQTANKAALSYVRQGMKPDEAARKVAAGIVNDKYEFIDTYRVPKTQNVSAVRAGVERSLEALSPDDLMPLPGIRGVTDAENTRQLHDAILGSGQWVPNNDETGLSLTLNGYRVLGKDGKPIVRTWEQLETEGMTKPAQRSVDPILGIYK